MQIQALVLGWHEDFECPGGDCGLTCCSADWKIALLDNEIEQYKNMNHEYRDEILKGIDFERKCMKTSNGKCIMLDENGYCKKVIHCGSGVLSKTCQLFPRDYVQYGDIMEVKVEIVCPVVAGYLFDEKPIDFTTAEVSCDNVPQIDYNVYDSLSNARTTLITLAQIESGKYIYGKFFIINKVFCEVKKLMECDGISMQSVQEILDKYCNEETIGQLFEQCEGLAKRIDAKIPIVYKSLVHLIDTGFMKGLTTHLHQKYPYIDEYFKIITNNPDELRRDLEQYIQFIREKYPQFMERFLIYVMYSNWIDLKKESFGNMFSCRLLEGFVIQMHGMAIWKHELNNGTLDETFKEKFAVAISAIDRPIAHSKALQEELIKYCNRVQGHELVDMVLLMIA